MKSILEEKFNRAIELQTAGKIDEAEVLYTELLNEIPENEAVLTRLFMINYAKNDLKKAMEYLTKSININQNPVAYKALGEIYANKRDFDQARECYLQALKVNPNDVDALLKMGAALLPDFKLDEAIEYFNKVIEIEPDNHEGYLNLASAYDDKLELDKAIEYVLKAINLKPNYAEALFLLGIIFLRQGNFSDGWKLYESRFYVKQGIKRIKSTKPFWDGSSLKDKTIFITHEGGFGDYIMAARFIPALKSMGAKVLLQPYAELEQLLRDNDLPADIISESEDINAFEFDYHLTAMSLPYMLNIDESNIPFKNGYLKANPQKIEEYKTKYFNNNKFKIGICWQCKNFYPMDKFRSLPDLSYLYPLAKLPGIKVYSLQKGGGEEQLGNLPDDVKIVNLGETFKDFSDTAAAIENLDLVISVDTSVAHLAGALGKATFVLLQYLPDWRWLLDREDSIWYEKIRLFRQKELQNWNDPLEKCFKSTEVSSST